LYFKPDGVGTNLNEAALAARVASIFTVQPTGQTGTLGQSIAQSISRTANACLVQVRDLTVPNAPANTYTFTMPTLVGTQVMPAEVALVTSFKNDNNLTAPIKNRRGRIYIGPLGTGLQINGNNEVEFSATVYNMANAAMKDLKNAVNQPTAASWLWVVWSKTLTTSFTITSGFTDKAPDIQRRRGIKGQGKVAWV
jgi:hypothetical protein